MILKPAGAWQVHWTQLCKWHPLEMEVILSFLPWNKQEETVMSHVLVQAISLPSHDPLTKVSDAPDGCSDPRPRVTHTQAYRPQARDIHEWDGGLWGPWYPGSTVCTKGEVSTEFSARTCTGPTLLDSIFLFWIFKKNRKLRQVFRCNFVILKYLLSPFKFLGKQKQQQARSSLGAVCCDFCPKWNKTRKRQV